MPDIIDINAGTIVDGPDTIQTKGEEILEFVIKIASGEAITPVSYTHLRAHETVLDLVCRLLLEKKNKNKKK